MKIKFVCITLNVKRFTVLYFIFPLFFSLTCWNLYQQIFIFHLYYMSSYNCWIEFKYPSEIYYFRFSNNFWSCQLRSRVHYYYHYTTAWKVSNGAHNKILHESRIFWNYFVHFRLFDLNLFSVKLGKNYLVKLFSYFGFKKLNITWN